MAKSGKTVTLIVVVSISVLAIGIPTLVYVTRDKSNTSFLDRDLRGYDSYVRGQRRGTPQSNFEDSNQRSQ